LPIAGRIKVDLGGITSMSDLASSRPVVLLGDDETAITDQLAPLLERAGFEVRVVHDGPGALRAVETDEPDVVVLDVLMPGMDGREVLRRLRAQGWWNPVLLLTQVGESTERAMALEEGADDYLNKPFDPTSWWPGCAPYCAGRGAACRRWPRLSGCGPGRCAWTGHHGGHGSVIAS